MAQGLRLHLDSKVDRTPLEIEMRRRVWHGCRLLDTVVSITLGRPLMLYGSGEVSHPQAINDEHLASAEKHSQDSISRIRFFVETVKLHDLMADVAPNLYDRSRDVEKSSGKVFVGASVDFVLDIEKKISLFEEEIPVILHWDRRMT